jgi:small-conductance mechanosensitive channel
MGTPLQAAQQAARSAEADLTAERRRLDALNREIAQLDATIQATDPDSDGKTFARVVGQRDAARGRAEALALRAEGLRKALEDARARLAAAEQEELEQDLARLNAGIGDEDRALTAETRAFAQNVATRVAALRKVVARANEVEAALLRARGSTSKPWTAGSCRGSSWAAAPLHALSSNGLDIAKVAVDL